MVRHNSENKFAEISDRRIYLSAIILIPLHIILMTFVRWDCLLLPISSKINVELTLAKSYFNLVFEIIQCCVLVIVFYPCIKQDLYDLYKTSFISNAVSLLKGTLRMILYSCLGFGFLFIVMTFLGINIPSGLNQAGVITIFKQLPSICAAALIISGPICEEILFRGLAFRAISRKTSTVIGIIVSSLLFGLMHCRAEIFSGQIAAAVVYIMFYSAGGAALAVTYNKRKNIIICILIHLLHNCAAFASVM